MAALGLKRKAFNRIAARLSAAKRLTRIRGELKLAAERDHPGFSADLRDLLPAGTGYDFETGFAVVERELIARL